MTEIEQLQMQNAVQGTLIAQIYALLLPNQETMESISEAYQLAFADQLGDGEESEYALDCLNQIMQDAMNIAEERKGMEEE
ncbi:MAG: hypothetical protein HON68_07975 [Gammaproteobacteria bacterium]|jgi:uncharacterized membrane protein|nr:hypothetical protein [Gammaproteobacteria bacterium]MBT3489049.1 hypothetical protein [Gammaproteobacteria bacterium]MBT3719582.1 hypothetical protein [Gammaproteobacteria bacterium]MBT3845704.1 hypothetical protein [Gammaproteobacteria bacterium]MBT3892644.1 hypothetical protein [Gammaproteobacteria bacterium]